MVLLVVVITNYFCGSFQLHQVRWNALGQPVGENSQLFVSYIGFLVRWYIPISMENWRSKEMTPYKDKVLEEMRVKYKLKLVDKYLIMLIYFVLFLVMISVVMQKIFIIGEERENFVKMEAGKLFRAFKTILTRFYLRDSNGDVVTTPPDHKYPRIDQEDWNAFVARRLSPDFQVICYGSNVSCK